MNIVKSLRKRLKSILPLLILLTVLAFSTAVSASETEGQPAIEWLKFQVPAQQQARFIEQDEAIWTPVLASYPGFKSKEIWTNPAAPDELIIVTHWASFDQWQAIPKAVLEQTTQRFHQAMGAKYIPESIGFRLAWTSSP